MFRKKASEKPLTKDNLPMNRREVFFDVIKLHYKEFIVLGWLTILFATFLIFLYVWNDLYLINLNQNLGSDATEEQIKESFKSIMSFTMVIRFIAIGYSFIFSLFISAMVRVIRQYAYEENVKLSYDLKMGIKQNYWMILGLILSAEILFSLSAYSFLLGTLNSGWISFLFYLPICAFVLFILPVINYAIVSTSIYKIGFLKNIKLCVLIYIKSILKNVFMTLIICALLVPMLFSNIFVHLIYGSLLCLFFPFLFLGYFLFALNQFDKFYNFSVHPELVNKGVLGLYL